VEGAVTGLGATVRDGGRVTEAVKIALGVGVSITCVGTGEVEGSCIGLGSGVGSGEASGVGLGSVVGSGAGSRGVS
jgi:hypothetical protein